jgi:N-acylglucosamine-6-phosphate 2-epimerase
VSLFAQLRGRLVVSCQAAPGSPLDEPAQMVAMARAAVLGGACAIRAEGIADVAAIAGALPGLPLVGLRKQRTAGGGVFITPTLADVRELAAAGATLVAVDATGRPRPDGSTMEDFLERAVRELGETPLLADADSLETGLRARAAGAAAVATTLSGYVGDGPVPHEPDVALVAALVAQLDCPVIAEGRYATPADVRAAFAAGAHAVVVGTAITDPVALTHRLAGATPAGAPS